MTANPKNVTEERPSLAADEPLNVSFPDGSSRPMTLGELIKHSLDEQRKPGYVKPPPERPTPKQLEDARAKIEPCDITVGGDSLCRYFGGGIYRIRDRVTGEFYIGRSRSFLGRFTGHVKMLADGNHHCRKLQTTVSASGLDAVEFTIIERCDPIIQEEREVHWVRELRPTLNTLWKTWGQGGPLELEATDGCQPDNA